MNSIISKLICKTLDDRIFSAHYLLQFKIINRITAALGNISLFYICRLLYQIYLEAGNLACSFGLFNFYRLHLSIDHFIIIKNRYIIQLFECRYRYLNFNIKINCTACWIKLKIILKRMSKIEKCYNT